MAFKILLILSILAIANARYRYDDDEDDAPPGFRRMYVPPLMQPPPFLSGFHTPLPLMQPPPLYVPIPGYRHHNVPKYEVPDFHTLNIPSPGDIKYIKPDSGQVFNGVSVRSSSGFTKDEDGNVVKTGGATIVVNDNGDVKEAKVGKNPPNIEDPIIIPSFQFKRPEMPKFEPFKHFSFEPITFKPFVYKPVTFKPIDVNYVPKEGEHFVSVSSSSHSESSDVNGVKKNSGGTNTVLNNNGKVEQGAIEFEAGDEEAFVREDTE